MKESSKKVLNYLKEVNGENVTADDVAKALGVETRSVNGSFTSFVKKGYGFRDEQEIQEEDGSHKKVKFLKLTAQGLEFDPDAEVADAE